MRGFYILALALAGVVPASGMADEPAKPTVVCPTSPVLPAEWKDWEKSTALKTMSKFQQELMDHWPPVLPQRTGLALHPISGVEYWVAPEKAILARTYGGMNSVKVAKAGRLKIALGEAAWIDLVRAGASATSVAHGHGPECSGIRKIVEFDVQPGTYLLQISNSLNNSISVMAIMAD